MNILKKKKKSKDIEVCTFFSKLETQLPQTWKKQVIQEDNLISYLKKNYLSHRTVGKSRILDIIFFLKKIKKLE